MNNTVALFQTYVVFLKSYSLKDAPESVLTCIQLLTGLISLEPVTAPSALGFMKLGIHDSEPFSEVHHTKI